MVDIINLSNHPSKNWSKEQLEEANDIFGKITDIPFPNIPPNMNSADLDNLVYEYLQIILQKKILNVHISGEPNFVYRLVTKLKQHNIKCYASTTERIVEQQDDRKISTFRFVQFREY